MPLLAQLCGDHFACMKSSPARSLTSILAGSALPEIRARASRGCSLPLPLPLLPIACSVSIERCCFLGFSASLHGLNLRILMTALFLLLLLLLFLFLLLLLQSCSTIVPFHLTLLQLLQVAFRSLVKTVPSIKQISSFFALERLRFLLFLLLFLLHLLLLFHHHHLHPQIVGAFLGLRHSPHPFPTTAASISVTPEAISSPAPLPRAATASAGVSSPQPTSLQAPYRPSNPKALHCQIFSTNSSAHLLNQPIRKRLPLNHIKTHEIVTEYRNSGESVT